MSMNRKALSINEAEMVNGGWDWECFGLGSFVGGTVGGTVVGAAALGVYAGVEEIS